MEKGLLDLLLRTQESGPTSLPSSTPPPQGLCLHRTALSPFSLLTWGPPAGRGWGARAPGGEDRKGQGKPPAWRARGAPPPGRTQQAEAQEQGPGIRAGLGARRGLCAAAWGWTWATWWFGEEGCRRRQTREREKEVSGPAPGPGPAHTEAGPAHARKASHAPEHKPRPQPVPHIKPCEAPPTQRSKRKPRPREAPPLL